MEYMALIGRWLMLAGINMAVIGGALWLVSRIPEIGQFPGTIRIEGPGFSCLFPLLASIVLSIGLTVLLNLVLRIINR